MQTDAWLTDASSPERCPLCSQLLPRGSNLCPACGFAGHEPAEKSAASQAFGQERSNSYGAAGRKAEAGSTRPSAPRQPNPITPIPARASAQRAQSKPGVIPRRSRSMASSASSQADQAELQGRSWQHESPSYEAASSLSALSLIISETPTAPPRPQPSTGSLEHIDEIDTVPQAPGKAGGSRRTSEPVPIVLSSIDEIDTVPQAPGKASGSRRTPASVPVVHPLSSPGISAASLPIALPVPGASSAPMPAVEPELPETPLPLDTFALGFEGLDLSKLVIMPSESAPPVPYQPDIDEIDTVPEAGTLPSRALVPLSATPRELAASWTASPPVVSSQAGSLVAARFARSQARRGVFTPLDRTRWWLLRPGHIEFLLWTAGSMLLFSVTFLILLSTVLSAMLPGLQSRGSSPISTVTTTAAASSLETPETAPGLRVALSSKSRLEPGAEMFLRGQGFAPHSNVVFLLDGLLPLLDRHGRPASARVDGNGHFGVDLWLGQGPDWSAGSHRVYIRETIDSHQAQTLIAITILAPATTAVPTSGGSGTIQSTPAPPVDPTAEPTRPTPTPALPTPTPTSVGPAPTAVASPTPASTGTPEKSSGTPTGTPAKSNGTPTGTPDPGASSSSLGNALGNEGGNSLLEDLAHLNPLIWLIGLCYLASLILLGVAGLLRRRRH